MNAKDKNANDKARPMPTRHDSAMRRSRRRLADDTARCLLAAEKPATILHPQGAVASAAEGHRLSPKRAVDSAPQDR